MAAPRGNADVMHAVTLDESPEPRNETARSPDQVRAIWACRRAGKNCIRKQLSLRDPLHTVVSPLAPPTSLANHAGSGDSLFVMMASSRSFAHRDG